MCRRSVLRCPNLASPSECAACEPLPCRQHSGGDRCTTVTELLSPQEINRRRQRGVRLQQEGNQAVLPEARFAILSSFGVDLLAPLFGEALERIGLYCPVYLGGFSHLAQEMLDPASGLYQARPEGVVLIPAVEDLLARLFDRPLALSPEEIEALVEERAGELERQIGLMLERLPSSVCYVVAFGTDRAPLEQILDPREPGRGQKAVERWLERIRAMTALSPRVVVVDWDWHTRAAGSAVYRDERLWYLGRMRLNPLGLATLAELIARYVAAYRGMARKVVAVDLDGTLWGGVVGEVGLDGLVLGEEGRYGCAARDLQQEQPGGRPGGVRTASGNGAALGSVRGRAGELAG